MAHAQPYATVRTDESYAAFAQAMHDARDEDCSLVRTVQYWYNTIKEARIKHLSWDTIAAEMCKAMGKNEGDIPGKALCDAFRRAGSVKHKRRLAASMSLMLEAALDLLAQEKRIGVKKVKRLVENYVPTVIEKRAKAAAEKKAARKAKEAAEDGEKTVMVTEREGGQEAGSGQESLAETIAVEAKEKVVSEETEAKEAATKSEEKAGSGQERATAVVGVTGTLGVRDKEISAFRLKEYWRQKVGRDTPAWMAESAIKLAVAREQWQAETGEPLPPELAAHAY